MLSDFLTGRKQHLPVILQSEASECGLACLAMVAAYFGHDINLTGLRRRYPVSNRGANFKKIMEIAAKLGLKSRPLKLELEQTENLKLPCILHWELNHFVVLKTIKGSHYLIHDPSTGERSLSSKDFSAGFTGVALELEPNHVFEPLIMRETLHLMQVFRGVRGLRSSGLQTLLLSCLIIGLTMAIPLLIQIVLDEVLVSKDQKMLLLLILGVGAVAIFRNVSSLLRGFLTIHVGTALSYHMSSSVYRHLLHLPLKFFQRRHMGDVIARFMVLEPLRKFLTEHLVEIIVDGVMMLFMALLMLAYSGKLSAISFAAMAIYGLFRFLTLKPSRRLAEEAIIAQSKQNTSFMESLRGIQSIKLYNGQAERQTIWQNLFVKELNAHSSIGRFRVLFEATKDLIFSLEKIAIIYFGVGLVFDNTFTAGMLIAFLSFKDQFSEKIATLTENLVQLKMLDVHLELLAEIVLHEGENSVTRMSLETLETFSGDLEIEGLGYRYDTDSPWLFRNLNLHAKPGESIAIIGPSGCGKTTLLKILVGLFEAEEGKILVDGHPLKFRKDVFQSSIATVMQDDHLLSGSIMDNIAFFDHEPDMERVISSAKLAEIHDEIMLMPMRFHSLIGDMGSTLSGGQKQRILLARALYRQPKILFLDEATSHLDHRLENLINTNVRQLRVTRVIIAHRKETILSADRILALIGGQLMPMERATLTAAYATNEYNETRILQ